MGDMMMLLCSVFTWSTLYFVLCLVNPKRSYEWHIRTVTTVHALTVTVLGLISIFVVGPFPFYEMGGPSSQFQQFVVAVSLGYFLLDLSWCLYFGTEGPVMLLHHSLSITGMSVTYAVRLYGTEIVTTIFGAEITNPLLQLRWFLRETKNYDSTLGDVVDVLFMVLFGTFRIGIGSVLLYMHYTMETTDWLSRFGGTCIYLVGWVFWISIVRYGYKKYNRKYGKGRSKKDSPVVNGTEKKAQNGHCNMETVAANGHANHEVNGNLHKRHIGNGTAGPSTETES